MTPLEIAQKLAELNTLLEMREDEVRAIRYEIKQLKDRAYIIGGPLHTLEFSVNQIGTL